MRQTPTILLAISILLLLIAYIAAYFSLLMPPMRQNDVVIGPSTMAGWGTHATGPCEPDYHLHNGLAMHAFFTPIHKLDRMVRRTFWEGGVSTKQWVER